MYTITAVRLTKMEEENIKRFWVPWAMFSFCIFVGQVLGTELTLRWNHVRGLQGIGTLGQLIPLVIGLGGLVKVFWEWFQSSWEKSKVALRDEGDMNASERPVDA